MGSALNVRIPETLSAEAIDFALIQVVENPAVTLFVRRTHAGKVVTPTHCRHIGTAITASAAYRACAGLAPGGG